MKIAILTQPLGKNYGGIMQAWALQQVLKHLQHKPVTINRQPDAKSHAYDILRFGYRTLQKAVGKRQAPINFERHLPLILQNTQTFIDQNLCMSEPIDNTEKLKAHFEREQYDAVIVGSDQTWRPRYSPNIDNYFLDFLQARHLKRIAYASSFGVDEWEFTDEQTRRFAPLAKRFDSISVREISAVELCARHLGVEAVHVSDPTLLLEKKNYELLFKNEEVNERNGIYTYILDRSDWKDKAITTVRHALSKPVYCNQPKASLSSLSSSDVQDYQLPSIESWIKGFAEADFVITDSYHGTLFAIMFNKPFISLANPNRGVSRFSSILDELDLNDRLLSHYDRRAIETILGQTERYDIVNAKIASLRARSKRFLSDQ